MPEGTPAKARPLKACVDARTKKYRQMAVVRRFQIPDANPGRCCLSDTHRILRTAAMRKSLKGRTSDSDVTQPASRALHHGCHGAALWSQCGVGIRAPL
ncbi:hypothetical protein, partial [Burkholderia cepacia]|uniref:hypothetical protein n=1 Tax=Burkholderia cepacia TaxID=292 RepID=UPI001C378BA1